MSRICSLFAALSVAVLLISVVLAFALNHRVK